MDIIGFPAMIWTILKKYQENISFIIGSNFGAIADLVNDTKLDRQRQLYDDVLRYCNYGLGARLEARLEEVSCSTTEVCISLL